MVRSQVERDMKWKRRLIESKPQQVSNVPVSGKTRGLDMMTVTSLDETKQVRPDSDRKLALMSVHWGE